MDIILEEILKERININIIHGDKITMNYSLFANQLTLSRPQDS